MNVSCRFLVQKYMLRVKVTGWGIRYMLYGKIEYSTTADDDEWLACVLVLVRTCEGIHINL